MKFFSKIISLLFFLFCFCFSAKANHVVGGNLSWSCLGNGQYVFEVNLTVECSTSLVAPTLQQIGVWNHPTIAAIPINLVSETDLSPSCTQVLGGPSVVTCANQSLGALKKYTYQSASISISGVPPLCTGCMGIFIASTKVMLFPFAISSSITALHSK